MSTANVPQTETVDLLFKPDLRPIDEMPFGAEERTPEARVNTAKRVRMILLICACNVADDINRLGCTGLVKHQGMLSSVGQMTVSLLDKEGTDLIEIGQFLRLGLAGGGVGLPCFVPPDRFCLVHNTIGGLERGQEQYYADYVKVISRELTPEEQTRVAVTERARRIYAKDGDREAAELLNGLDPTTAADVVEEALGVDVQTSDEPTIVVHPHVAAWLCTEHDETDWSCRHCLAQAIVEGPLEPVLVTAVKNLSSCKLGEGMSAMYTDGDAVGDFILDSREEALNVFVLAASFRRKLSRE